MIYAELAGGLGNQMFIYAFARALGLRTGQPVTLLDRQDWRDGAPAHTAAALHRLCIDPGVRLVADAGFARRALPLQNALKTLMIKREQRGGMLSADWQGFEARMAPMLNRLGVHFATDGCTPCRWRGRPRDLLAWGYFQSEAYFADAAPAVRAELRTRPAVLAAAPAASAALADRIARAAQPVCLHLRRGDYQAPANAIFQVCTPDYYRAAVRMAAQAVPGASLFVFSDDEAFARALLADAALPAVFAPGGAEAAADLALMQRCRHFILSNSTFSWWAQYLADAPDKLVFAPDRWYANDKSCALYQPGWRTLPAAAPAQTAPAPGKKGDGHA